VARGRCSRKDPHYVRDVLHFLSSRRKNQKNAGKKKKLVGGKKLSFGPQGGGGKLVEGFLVL